MAATAVMSLSLKPSPFVASKSAVKGLPSLARNPSSFKVIASGGKKIKTDKPYGVNGGMALRNGLDASGRKPKGKGVYQYVDKYGANVDGYSPIYNEDEWSPSGDVYVGGTTGLLIWAVTYIGWNSRWRCSAGLQHKCFGTVVAILIQYLLHLPTFHTPPPPPPTLYSDMLEFSCKYIMCFC